MMRLKERGMIPYGGLFVVNRPDLNVVGRGLQFVNLVDSVKRWRQANGIPIGLEFESEVEVAACQEYPNECINTDPNKPTMRNLGIQDIITGTRVMMGQLTSGTPLVSREEAERRARICVACPWNRWFAKPCGGICGELKALVSRITDNQGTQYDSQLHSCNICGCFLQSSIWVSLEVQWPPLADTAKNQFLNVPQCWKRPPTIDTTT